MMKNTVTSNFMRFDTNSENTTIRQNTAGNEFIVLPQTTTLLLDTRFCKHNWCTKLRVGSFAIDDCTTGSYNTACGYDPIDCYNRNTNDGGPLGLDKVIPTKEISGIYWFSTTRFFTTVQHL